MLILSRKRGESILIPELGVTIKVMGVCGGQVRIGVDADKAIKIFREEMYDGAGSGGRIGGDSGDEDVHRNDEV